MSGRLVRYVPFMSAPQPQDQIPPMDEPAYDEMPPAPEAEQMPEPGQRGPASDQTGAEQTGVDDTAPQGGPAGDPTVAREGFAAQGNQQASAQGATDGDAGDQEMLGAGTGGTDGPVKDPEDWVTGDQPATDAQKSYLDSLARQAGEQIPADLTKAEASEHIDRLQAATGRDQQG